ncbi:DUF1275 domain-containing protein [Mycobacterium sp. MYCO198283]|uniref:YoaK family protein n=1 Tax=Mycobacterium sp. MYCO198283 TaxID=2883505 RepID=UPI001E2CB587|nr:YoaK family protein [Mycobacterium sp. MYCO198283]MCG5433249.1 DUF1275 domain-containing protein [Mycobacterium sp. MYCO198283]
MTAPPPTSTTLRFAVLLTFTNGFVDAYTFLVRGGVFANVQTGNVIFFALDIAHRQVAAALAHVWPIAAFVAGVALASHIRSGRVDRYVPRPLRWTMAVQALTMAVIGVVPAAAPHSVVTIPISFLAAMQMELFRSVGGLNYLPVATTGNLMRLVEAGYGDLVDRDADARTAFRIYLALLAAFGGGAVVGAYVTDWWGTHAIWWAAATLAVTVVLFVVDERAGREP